MTRDRHLSKRAGAVELVEGDLDRVQGAADYFLKLGSVDSRTGDRSAGKTERSAKKERGRAGPGSGRTRPLATRQGTLC